MKRRELIRATAVAAASASVLTLFGPVDSAAASPHLAAPPRKVRGLPSCIVEMDAVCVECGEVFGRLLVDDLDTSAREIVCGDCFGDANDQIKDMAKQIDDLESKEQDTDDLTDRISFVEDERDRLQQKLDDIIFADNKLGVDLANELRDLADVIAADRQASLKLERLQERLEAAGWI